ncbi:MAG: VWA domain-containing protein [Planctomycetota bacterium]|nr:VWA domain-containing protein [Planctomycetota bacterium]
MNSFLALLSSAEAGTGVRETFRFLDLPEAWIVVLIVLPLCAGIAWIAYRSEELATGPRATLIVLRFLALVLLAAVLCRPVFVQRREEVRPAEVVVLLDDSASMSRKDAYSTDERARNSLRELVDRPAGDVQRVELARAAYTKVLAPILQRGGYVPRVLRFSEGAEPLPDVATLAARGRATHLGDALQQALAMHRGRHVTDVVILSDGRGNGGLSALEAARAAASAGIPVHTVVVGDARPEKNLIVELAEAPTSVLEGDEIALAVRIVGRGLEPHAKVRVVLEELPPGGSAGAPRPLTEEDVEADESGTRVVLVAPPEGLEPGASERRFRARVPARNDETLRDDNAIEVSVHVAPEKVRVLYVDGYPRWEYRYLKNLLLRADANLEVQCYLLSATPDFLQESSRGANPLAEVPTSRKELLERYDVIILGDVNPFEISPDPARCEEFLASVREFVERGGGLILQAGENDAPRSFAGTALEELLPVVLDPNGASSALSDTTREFRPRLEDPALPHEIVRLTSDPATNRTLWEEPGGLRGFYWFQAVSRAKPGAQVLLRHPEAENQHGRIPLLVAGYFPAGRTLYLGVDATWAWRYRFGDRYHERFWRNAIRWVALGRLKSGDRRVQLDAAQSSFDLDERVTLEARVLDEDFRPSEKPAVEARLQHPDGTVKPFSLVRVTDRAGLYRASFDVERPGLYSAWIESEGRRVASAEFEVVLPSRENADPTPDPETMSAVASLTHGRAVDLARVRELASEFPGGEEHREPISAELIDAWDRWGTLLLALAVLSIEWVLRKRWEMV